MAMKEGHWLSQNDKALAVAFFRLIEVLQYYPI